jgi:hypothetical protein
MVNDILAILSNQLPRLAKAAVSLPVAAALAAALAFRPRRYSTPRRDLEVIHTQIIRGRLRPPGTRRLRGSGRGSHSGAHRPGPIGY